MVMGGGGSTYCRKKFTKVWHWFYIWLGYPEPQIGYHIMEITMRWMAEGEEQDKPATFASLFEPHYTVVLLLLRLRTAEVYCSSKHCDISRGFVFFQ